MKVITKSIGATYLFLNSQMSKSISLKWSELASLGLITLHFYKVFGNSPLFTDLTPLNTLLPLIVKYKISKERYVELIHIIEQIDIVLVSFANSIHPRIIWEKSQFRINQIKSFFGHIFGAWCWFLINAGGHNPLWVALSLGRWFY